MPMIRSRHRDFALQIEDGTHEFLASAPRRAATLTVDQPVVVVDSNLQSLGVLAPVLAAAGYRLLPAQSGAEALSLMAESGARLLVIDESMLDQSGIEWIRRVRCFDAAAAIVARGTGLDAAQRRRLRQRLDVFAVSDRADEPLRLVELLDAAAAGLRGLDRTRGEQTLRGLVLAKLCHDLRSALHVIHGYAQLLEDDPALPAALAQVQGRLATTTRHACDLTDRYLALAHVEAPDVAAQRALVNVDAMIADLRAEVEGMRSGRPGLVVYPFATGRLLHTDREKLQAVLTNLVGASFKFSTAAPVELHVDFGADHTDFVIAAHGPGTPSPLDAASADVALEALEPVLGTAGQSLAVAVAMRLGQILGADVSARTEPDGALRFAVRLPGTPLLDGSGGDQPTIH